MTDSLNDESHMKIYSVLLPFFGVLSTIGRCAETSMIASFEGPGDSPFVAHNSVISHVQEHATKGVSSLRVDIKSQTPGTPGIFLPATDRDWTQKSTIALDVFNPSDEPVLLSMRLDSVKDGSVGYGLTALQPGHTRNLAVNIGHFRPYHDFSEVYGLLIGVTEPKKDVTIYIDNVRWMPYQKKFHRIEYLETLRAPEPTLEEQNLGFITFRRHYMSLVFPQSLPDQRCKAITIFAAKGEREPVAVSLHPLRDLPSVTVTASDLHGPNDSVIPSTQWSARLLQHQDKREGYPFDTYVADMPMYLELIDHPVTLSQTKTATYWLTLDVPRECISGVYRGTVIIQSGELRQEVPLAVRVLPFSLPDNHNLIYGEYYVGASKTILSRDQIRRDLQDMREHGATSLGLWFTADPSTYKVDGESVSFQLEGDSQFEWLMDAYAEFGFPGPIVMGFDAGMDAADSVFKYGDLQWDRVYINFHKALAAEVEKRGWPQIYVQPLDEVSWHSNEEKEKNLHLLKLLKSAGIATEINGAADTYMTGEAGAYADMWTISSTFVPAATLADAQTLGKITTIYNVDTEGWLPEANRWARGLYLWKSGLHGLYNWAYRHAYGSYYDDFDAEHGENVHMYPPEPGRRGGPSTGWEVSREGIDDLKYLILLERYIRKGQAVGGKAAQLAEDASAMLQKLKDGLDDNTDASRNRARWTEMLSLSQAMDRGLVPQSSEIIHYVSGQQKIPNGLSLDEYDAIRWMVATHICGLMEVLGESSEALSATEAIAEHVATRVRNVRSLKAQDSIDRPEIVVPSLSSTPTIDGLIDVKDEWSSASRVDLTMDNGSGDPQMQTQFFCGFRDSTFYVAAICSEARIQQMTANVKEDGGPVFTDDCVEIFLDPGKAEEQYFQVAVNSLGKILKIDSGGNEWSANIRAAAHVDVERKLWMVEMAIPVEGMNLGKRFGLNFCRERRALDTFELSAWSPTGGSFARMDRFGTGMTEGANRVKRTVEPGLALKIVPGHLVRGGEEISLIFDVRLPEGMFNETSIDLCVRGNGREIVAAIRQPLDERIMADFAVVDLPAGEYQVSAVLKGPRIHPREAAASFMVVRGIE